MGRLVLALLVCLLWGLAVPAEADVAFDAFSASAAGTTTRSWTHTPVGTPRAALIFCTADNGVDEISTVTYGGTAATELSGSPNLLTTGETGQVSAFFLGASIPTGAQTVVCTASATTNNKVGTAITLTGGADTETIDIDATVNGANVTNPSVTLSLSSRTAFAALGYYSGHVATATAPLSGWTARSEVDGAAESIGVYSYDTVSTSDVTAGWTQTDNDAVMIAVAVSEVVAGGVTPKGLLLGVLP